MTTLLTRENQNETRRIDRLVATLNQFRFPSSFPMSPPFWDGTDPAPRGHERRRRGAGVAR